MRLLLPLLMFLPAAGVSSLDAQVSYYAGLGLTYATALIKDRIVNDEIEARQQLAPTLVLGAALPIAPRYRAGLEATLTTSGYRGTEEGTDTDLGTLRTGSVSLGLDGPVAPRLRWRAGVGLIGYWPSEDRGIFLRGGTTRLLAGAGLDYRQPITTKKWELMASLRYDYYRFSTDELQARGFGQNQGVQRISASLGIAKAGL